MKCPICDTELIIANTRERKEFDESDLLKAQAGEIPFEQVKIYVCLDQNMVCVNGNLLENGQPCPNYAGEDLSNPAVIVQTATDKRILE